MRIYTTERVVAREFTKEDLPTFMAYRNDLAWMKYQEFKGLSEAEYSQALLTKTTFTEGKQLAICLNETGELIGDVFVLQQNQHYAIGYTLHPVFSKQGLAREMVAGLIDYLAEQGAVAIHAWVKPENRSSIRLIEQLNFIFSRLDEGQKLYSLELA